MCLMCSLLEPMLYSPALLKVVHFCQQRSEQEQVPGENVQPGINTSSEHSELDLQISVGLPADCQNFMPPKTLCGTPCVKGFLKRHLGNS